MLEQLIVIDSETDKRSKFDLIRLKRSLLNYFCMARYLGVNNENDASSVLDLTLDVISKLNLKEISSNELTSLLMASLIELGGFFDVVYKMND